MKLTFLGTASAFVTADRDNTYYYIEVGEDRIMLDCAGNPAGKLLQIDRSPSDLDIILFTHLHIDHCYGLPALLFHMFLDGRTRQLPIAAPDEEFDELNAQLQSHRFDPDIRTFELDKILIPNDAYVNVWSSEHSTIYASPSDHSRSGRAFRIEEKTTGKSIVFSGDSRPVSSIEKLSQKATLLVHEATFLEADSMLAQDFGHSTASDAAVIAQTADVSKLALIHFDLSDGHSVTEFKREASTKYQGEIIRPNDMDCIEI